MQLTRRKAILGMSVAAAATAISSNSGVVGWLRPILAEAGSLSDAGAAEQSLDEHLRRELAAMASREDSEEGVPVLLACINQVADIRTHKVPPAKLTPWNASVAVAMRENAAAWQRNWPDAPAGDVAHLIQVLAERDFAAGGLEQQA